MNPFLVATAHAADGSTLVRRCLDQLTPAPTAASLGFIYATDQLCADLGEMVEELRRRLPGVQWVGSVGVGICSTAREFYDEPALAIMIGQFPEQSFQLLPRIDLANLGIDTSLAGWHAAGELRFSLLHGDPSAPRTPEILHRFAHSGINDFVNGGLTSSHSHNYQVCNDVLSGAVSGVAFRQDVAIATDHTQGCTPIGPVHEITEAQRNIAVKLDSRPALEILRSDIGEVLARDLTKLGGYIFAALPIRGSDTGDYLVRNLIGLDEAQGLIAIGQVLDDQDRLMFCRRDGNTARTDMQIMLQRLKRRIGNGEVRGGVYISCLGRGRYQFGEDSEELKMIRDALGEFPLVGFFANGEIYNGRLYGYTGVLTLFL